MNRIMDIAASARGEDSTTLEPIELADFTATRRMVFLPLEYLLPPWLRPARPVVRDRSP